MKTRFHMLAMVLVVCMLTLSITATGCVAYPVGYGSSYGGYTYYDLPPGYQYEYWSNGPVIVNTVTGAIVTIALLRSLYPHWYPRRIHHPHFVRDWRVPSHRAHWHHHRPHHGGGYHMAPPPSNFHGTRYHRSYNAPQHYYRSGTRIAPPSSNFQRNRYYQNNNASQHYYRGNSNLNHGYRGNSNFNHGGYGAGGHHHHHHNR